MLAALKEWRIVCRALEDGRQVVLLRKGGVLEYRQGFEIKHESFWLYPTLEHQSTEFIQPDYVEKMDDLFNGNQRKNIKKKFSQKFKKIYKKKKKSFLPMLQRYLF